MSISYDVAAASLALGVPEKWLDNVLSRHRVNGVGQSRQGITRRLSLNALVTLAVVRILCERLHVPTREAVAIASAMTPSGDIVLPSPVGALRLSLDLAAVRMHVSARLADAVEGAPRRPRGRRPRRPLT